MTFEIRNRFYPLYPPAEGIPLDFSLAPESLHISSIPDILILPSDMKYFVKVRNMPSACLFKASLNTEVAATAYMVKDSQTTYIALMNCAF